MATGMHTFHYTVERSGDDMAGRVAKVICHGSLVNQTSGDLRDAVKMLIDDGGQIILDFHDGSFVDSLGLGMLVGLKVSAIWKDQCKLDLEHVSPRVQELLKLTRLTEVFKS